MAQASRAGLAPILEELQKEKDLTLALIWQERRESDPEGYGCSRFCELYRRWLNKRDLVLRHEHRAGEKLFVDYAGATIPIYDGRTGQVQEAAVFVAVQGASSYTFAEATAGRAGVAGPSLREGNQAAVGTKCLKFRNIAQEPKEERTSGGHTSGRSSPSGLGNLAHPRKNMRARED